MRQDIIAPVPVEAIMDELTCDKFFRKTNNAGNEIYIITAQDSPNIMREIGRLREISFRDSGGGTGLDCDIDEFDTRESGIQSTAPLWAATVSCFATICPLTNKVRLTRPPANCSGIRSAS